MSLSLPIATYLESHEWHKLEGDTVTIGITQTAADELTDITFVAFQKSVTKLTAQRPLRRGGIGEGDSDLYIGVSGTVTAINEKLTSKSRA